jgi:drug/metabolite transporter (DMT)-like permease
VSFAEGGAGVLETETPEKLGAAVGHWRARLDVGLAALLFSTGGVFIKALTGLTAWQRAGLRSLVAAAFLLAVWPRARRGISGRSLVFGLFYAATMATFVAANTYTTSANAIFLQSTAPLWVLLLSPLVLRERATRADLLFMLALAAGLALCFSGELLASGAAQRTAPRPVLGNVFAIASGVLWACTIVGLRWLAQPTRESGNGAAASVVAGNLLCFLGCALLSALLGQPFFSTLDRLDVNQWLSVLFLGCLQIGLAYVVLTRGMERVVAMEASLLLLVEPVFNPLWTFLVHGERPGAFALAGGAVILGATAVHAGAAPPRTIEPTPA